MRPLCPHRVPYARSPLLLLLLAVMLAACGADRGDERVPLDGPSGAQGVVEELPPELQERLDSANLAFRGGDYSEALRHFEELTSEAPNLAAGWYGVGMTQSALGNAEAADSAMMQVHRLAPEIPLEHPGTTAPPNPHASPPAGGGATGGS